MTRSVAVADVLSVVLPPSALKYVAKHYLVAYAVFVMVLLVFSPSGIIGFIQKRAAARKALRTAMAAPADGGVMSTVLEVRDVSQALRRHSCGRRRVVRREGRRNPRHHRAERFGQVDAVQLHPRPASSDLGRGEARRASR